MISTNSLVAYAYIIGMSAGTILSLLFVAKVYWTERQKDRKEYQMSEIQWALKPIYTCDYTGGSVDLDTVVAVTNIRSWEDWPKGQDPNPDVEQTLFSVFETIHVNGIKILWSSKPSKLHDRHELEKLAEARQKLVSAWYTWKTSKEKFNHG